MDFPVFSLDGAISAEHSSGLKSLWTSQRKEADLCSPRGRSNWSKVHARQSPTGYQGVITLTKVVDSIVYMSFPRASKSCGSRQRPRLTSTSLPVSVGFTPEMYHPARFVWTYFELFAPIATNDSGSRPSSSNSVVRDSFERVVPPTPNAQCIGPNLYSRAFLSEDQLP